MKTLLYKPLFINPQAYYVFPNINGRLEPKTDSGKEPAIFVGNIEVKTIAHGDIGKKQYFYNTNEIDLSAFSNSLVRISLYTNRGNVVLGEWNLDIIEGESENYIDPEVLASLVAVCICDGKSNNDPDRAVIKNLVDPDNPFVISNAAYEGMSGHNGYPVVFGANKTWKQLPTYNSIYSINDNKIHITKVLGANRGLIFSYVKQNDQLLDITEIPSFKIKVSGLKGDSKLRYSYIKTENAVYQNLLDLDNGIHKLPKSLRPTDSIVNGSWIGFTITPIVENEITFDCDITIEVLPEYEGAFVTDGKDDLITSTKTVKEMLGGSNEVTVVSMMANLDSSQIMCNSNFSNTNGYNVRNTLEPNGVISMLGYTDKNGTTNNLNLIMGDKNSIKLVDKVNFNSDYVFYPSSYNAYSFKTAWYWTIIANKVLTTDQINQVISYFNLDKHVKPDVYYDTIRQGITNENHASFNDELVDFSGNGHNMKIYNSAWNKESGINDEGAWQTDGVSDYGNVENLPILKDYTVAIERRWITSPVDKNQCLAFKGHTNDWGAFACEFSNAGQLRSYTFSPVYNILQSYNEKSLVYQSKYSYSGTPIDAKATIDGSTLRLCLPRGSFPFYANVAIKMFLLFPYSLSEFLLERQLKRYKLGTLYPGMIEWRPKVNINVPVVTPPTFSMNNGSDIITNGQYIPEGTEITIRIFTTTDSSVGGINEATAKINGVDIELFPSGNKTYYGGKFIVSSKQKIDITIDEYIRYENIVQPYPAIINLKQDGKTITWGDKLKVGSDIVFVGSANLLPELYTVSETRYNGVTLYPNTIIKVEKSMVFDNARTYLKANEPSCILSPNRLRIPNSSYKILGYIPDLTGKGNHGRLNNFAYTEESGANEDGSIRFDGTDDHIIIPTIKHGGKALLMKVNWRYKNNIAMAYDQRINWSGLGISISRDQLPLVAYKPYNKVTYIDGIKNESVLVQDLEGITHNITGIYDNLDLSDGRDVCISRTSDASNSGFADMSMYEFMLFPDVPNEEEIKELNDIVGIEGNVWGTLTQLINSTLISNETLIKNE